MPLLVTAKSAGIGCLVIIAAAQAAHAATHSCTVAARQLAGLVRNVWPPPDASAPGSTIDMVGLVARKPSAGFVRSVARFKLAEYSKATFAQQVKHLPRPFTPSSELSKALDELQGAVTFFDLPGTSLFAANTIGGTANCNSTLFFAVRRGHADLVPPPEQWENDAGGSCGLTRSFASVEGMPVIIDDSLDAGPSLASTLTLTPWGQGKWRESCTANFVFAPRFDTAKTWNDWPSLGNWETNACGAGGCDGFQRAALELVRQTQQDRVGVEDHLLAAMIPAQRGEYQRLKRAHGAEPPADDEDAAKPKTAASLTETNPLLLPMLVNNRVFLASVGHFTIGWRVFADWKVAVETAESDKVREIARFAIGMTQGPIASVTVK